MKTAVVIFDTKHGNTKQIAEEICTGIREAGDIDCTAANYKDTDPSSLTSYDGILFGCPVHVFTATRGMRGFIKRAAKAGLAGKIGATFETYLATSHLGKATKKLESIISDKAPDLSMITPGFSALVKSMEGPLEESEIPKAREFGQQFGQRLLE
jgi:flavodoxin